MFFLTRLRRRNRLFNKLTALVLCLLILVGADLALPVFSQGAAGTGCNMLQEQIEFKSSLPLPIQRQRLATITSQANESGVTVSKSEERISFVNVETSDLFAVPPGSPLIVANPPYPYRYTEACWGEKKMTMTADPASERTMIMMPQKLQNFWDRTGNLVVRAQLPSLTVGNSSPLNSPFNPGPVDIKLKDLPIPTTTANKRINEDDNPSLDSKFLWSFATPPDSGASLSSTTGKSTKLTLPKSDKADKLLINVEYDNNYVGSVLFEKGEGEKNWTYRKLELQPDSLYYLRRNLNISSRRISGLFAMLAALVSYLGISFSVYFFNRRTTKGFRGFGDWRNWKPEDWRRTWSYLNPVTITAGPYGRASLSRLQLLWFTIVVMSVLVYLLSLTGDLSDLPESVLVLLGISAAGTVGTLGVDSTKNRLNFVNWQWLNDQGWLSEVDKYGGEDAKSKPADNYGKRSRWQDLLLDEGGVVNVYKFQLFFTSFLVGVFLILSGGSNLRGFRLPENFPQLLGISNLFYVFGRSVQPTGFDDLDKKITSLIDKEKALKSSVSSAPTPSQRPALLDEYLLEAKSAAGMTKVLFCDLADTKFEKCPIQDQELLPPWAQKYEKDWLK